MQPSNMIIHDSNNSAFDMQPITIQDNNNLVNDTQPTNIIIQDFNNLATDNIQEYLEISGLSQLLDEDELKMLEDIFKDENPYKDL